MGEGGMIYEYSCTHCGECFDVIKVVADMDRAEYCKACNQIAKRQFVPSRLHLSGTKVEHAEYNPGLGCVTKSKRHRAEIAKQKGLVELGNEKPDSIHKHFDGEREQKLAKPYLD